MNQPALAPESGFFRIRIDLSYDGTNFYGWGKQADRRTVQGELEAALFTLFQINLDTVVAGRTDAGVHASGQVCHVDVPENDYTDIAYRLNRILNDEIRIKSVTQVSDDFHARFGALRRHYIYKIKDGNGFIVPTARLDITPWYRNLDIDLMNQAAATLIGEHDFFSYARFREKATTIRDLQRFEFERTPDGLIIAKVVYIGESRFPVSWAKEILDQRERPSDSVVFPAKGLTFVGVDYPAESELRSRILKTMQHRNIQDETEEE